MKLRTSKAVEAGGRLIQKTHAWETRESSGSGVKAWQCISRTVIAGNAGQVCVICVCETSHASCRNLRKTQKGGGKEKQTTKQKPQPSQHLLLSHADVPC